MNNAIKTQHKKLSVFVEKIFGSFFDETEKAPGNVENKVLCFLSTVSLSPFLFSNLNPGFLRWIIPRALKHLALCQFDLLRKRLKNVWGTNKWTASFWIAASELKHGFFCLIKSMTRFHLQIEMWIQESQCASARTLLFVVPLTVFRWTKMKSSKVLLFWGK